MGIEAVEILASTQQFMCIYNSKGQSNRKKGKIDKNAIEAGGNGRGRQTGDRRQHNTN